MHFKFSKSIISCWFRNLCAETCLFFIFSEINSILICYKTTLIAHRAPPSVPSRQSITDLERTIEDLKIQAGHDKPLPQVSTSLVFVHTALNRYFAELFKTIQEEDTNNTWPISLSETRSEPYHVYNFPVGVCSAHFEFIESCALPPHTRSCFGGFTDFLNSSYLLNLWIMTMNNYCHPINYHRTDRLPDLRYILLEHCTFIPKWKECHLY